MDNVQKFCKWIGTADPSRADLGSTINSYKRRFHKEKIYSLPYLKQRIERYIHDYVNIFQFDNNINLSDDDIATLIINMFNEIMKCPNSSAK